MKEVVKHAKIQAEARIRTPANGEQVIASGMADMVSLVRAQIADPELANKAEDGRPDDIRPCINCNQQCMGRRLRDYWISCLVNPTTGREVEWSTSLASRADKPKHVLVIGGGPAGMEAARVSAERGHRVTLVEKSEKLGGRFRLAAKQPKRHEIGEFMDWQERQLTKHQVDVRRSTTLGIDEIKALEADAIIMATGSRPADNGFQRAFPHIEKLEGADLSHVTSPEVTLDDAVVLGKRVLIVDDDNGWRSVGTALYLAERDHAVTILTAALHPGQEIAQTVSAGIMMKDLARAGIGTIVSSAALAIGERAVRVQNLLTGEETDVPADSVLLATMPVVEADLEAALRKEGIDVTAVGDCVAPRKASMAIYEARS
ncbi:MAG: FAD-dependent oxidoreductase [Pseudomonadota bacterium]